MKSHSISSESSFMHSSPTNTAVELISWSIYPVLGDQAIKVVGCLKQSGHKKASGSITMRVNSRCIASKSGRMYNLIGPICDHNSLPSWLVKDFCRGFPANWKESVRKYLEWLESVQSDTESDIIECDKELKIKHNLFKWAIHVRESQLYVEGFVLSENGVPQLYRTSAIDEAVNKHLLKTITGSFYSLKGPICLESTLQAKIPSYLAHRFDDGFPVNWKELIPVMIRCTEVESESFHGIAVDEIETTSVWSREMKQVKRESVPHLEWASFVSSVSGSNDSTLNVSGLSTDVQIPNTVTSNQRLVTKSIKNEIDRISIKDISYSDDFQTPTNTKASKLTDTFSTVKKSKTSTPVNNGFYRTRSGRHVVPPLQHWTGQRLVTEYNDSGKQVVVLYPGEKSLLPDDHISPVHDALRTSSWLQRQYKMDQLLQTPSRCPTRKRDIEPNCVKRLSTSVHTPDKNFKTNMACKVVLTPLPSKTLLNEHKSNLNGRSQLEETTQKEPATVPALKNVEGTQARRSLRSSKKVTQTRYFLRKSYEKENIEHESVTKKSFTASKITPKKAKLHIKQVSKVKKSEAGTGTKPKPPKKKSVINDAVTNTKKRCNSNLDTPKNVLTNKPKTKRKRGSSLYEPNPKRPTQKLDIEIKSRTTKQDDTTEVMKVTAKKGTLKHRRQVKVALGTINADNHISDVFSDKTTSQKLNSNYVFTDINFGMFDAAVTPSTKISCNFTTPSWFKTPVVGGGTTDSLLQSETPAHLRCAPFTEIKQTVDGTDKTIVNVQKMKEKNGKNFKTKKTPIRHRKKLHLAKHFTAEIISQQFYQSNGSIHSSDDEYFSDS